MAQAKNSNLVIISCVEALQIYRESNLGQDRKSILLEKCEGRMKKKNKSQVRFELTTLGLDVDHFTKNAIAATTK